MEYVGAFLRVVLQKVKREAGELRFYPPCTLASHLIQDFRNIRDVVLGEEVLAMIMILLQECRDEYVASLNTYINLLPQRDPPYRIKLLHP
jgi:hypothetical protein